MLRAIFPRRPSNGLTLTHLPPSGRYVRHTRFLPLAAADPDGRPMMAWTQNAWNKALRNPSAMIIANTATQSALRLVSNIILARLLDPSAFALTMITSLILTGVQMVSDVGIAITALRQGELSRDDEDRLWTMQLARGIGVGILVAAIALPVAWIYHDTRLRDVLFALALMPALQGAQSLYPILALAHRRLLPSTLIELGGRIVAMTVSILIALVSPTVWSLVIGTLLAVVFTTLASHVLSGRLPRFILDRDYIRRQWQFSRWIQTSSTLTFISMQIDKALFPFLFGMTAFGLYGIGAAFATIPSQVTLRWSASVFYPLTVQLMMGEARAKAQLFGVRTTMLLYCIVVAITMMAISPAFFLLLYDPRYYAAARFAQILALGTYFDVAEASLRHLPLVDGKPHYEVWAVIAKLVGFGMAALVVYASGSGMLGYAWSYVFGLLVSYVFMLVVDVRRGYLSPMLDILLTTGLGVAAALIYFTFPAQASSVDMIIQAVAIAMAGGGMLLAIYVRRGLPSLPAEPAPDTLREIAEDELGEYQLRG
jgi:O-antigen/teichoic acid export membrane protein